MTLEEFYNDVAEAARTAKGYEHLGFSVTLALEKFRLDQESAQQPRAADALSACANCEYKPCDFIPKNHADYCPARR